MPNDIRGSGSRIVISEPLRELGPIHPGRKPVQPPREELRAFLRQAEESLTYPVLWFGEAQRAAIAKGISATLDAQGYTCYACAILQNHAHLLVRRHRDEGQAICRNIAEATRGAIRATCPELANHPVWGRDNCDIFKDSVEKMWDTVRYIRDNPAQSGLPPQSWSFVTPYDGWPSPRRSKTP